MTLVYIFLFFILNLFEGEVVSLAFEHSMIRIFGFFFNIKKYDKVRHLSIGVAI